MSAECTLFWATAAPCNFRCSARMGDEAISELMAISSNAWACVRCRDGGRCAHASRAGARQRARGCGWRECRPQPPRADPGARGQALAHPHGARRQGAQRRRRRLAARLAGNVARARALMARARVPGRLPRGQAWLCMSADFHMQGPGATCARMRRARALIAHARAGKWLACSCREVLAWDRKQGLARLHLQPCCWCQCHSPVPKR